MSGKDNKEDNVITYETFRKFHRKEKNNDELQELPEEFYSSCKKWLKRKDKEFDRSRGDTTPLYELENVKRIVRDIFDRRERKIMLMALQTVRSNISPKNLMSEEKDFYDKMVSILRDYRENFLNSVLNLKRDEDSEEHEEEREDNTREEETDDQKEDDLEKGESEGEISDSTEQEESEPEDTKENIKLKAENMEGKMVRIFEDMPQFLDEEEKKHGPFKKEDLVRLPENIADLLIDRGKAEEVEV
ncbi:MAG: hypothetical protein ABEK36_02600 [Candidatus Aenigmatarchaeota archaeon]